MQVAVKNVAGIDSTTPSLEATALTTSTWLNLPTTALIATSASFKVTKDTLSQMLLETYHRTGNGMFNMAWPLGPDSYHITMNLGNES